MSEPNYIDQITLDGVTRVIRDTTLESKQAASSGTDLSLVTTGEKYTWNNAAPFVPIFTLGSNFQWSCNKTFAEVLAAVQANKCVECVMYYTFNNRKFSLILGDYSTTEISFNDAKLDTVNNEISSYYCIYKSNGSINTNQYYYTYGPNFAPNYSNLTFPIAEGTMCMYNGSLYRAIQNIQTSEDFSNDHWDYTSVADQVSLLQTSIDAKYTKPSGGIPSADLSSSIQTSLGKADTAYQKPSSGIPATDIASGVIPNVSSKADKVSNATSGNFAALDSNGNLTDSGHKHADYLTVDNSPVEKGTGISSVKIKDFAGSVTVASGMAACVFGVNNTASGNGSVVFGINNSATQLCATAVGTGNTATATCAFAEGMSTKASSQYQHVQGKNNVEDANDVYAHIVGNGSSNNARSNAYSLTWTGDGRYAGDVYVGCSTDSSGGFKLAKLTDIPSITGKADKVVSATNGNFAALDSNGNLTDSGKKASDFGTYSKPSGGIPSSDLADSYIKEPSSDGTSGQVLTTNGSGGRSWTTISTGTTDYSSLSNKPSINSVTLSGNKSLSDLGIAAASDLSGKADKVSSATSGNFAALDSNGNLTDSGHKHSDYLTSVPVMSSTTLGGAYIDDTISSITVWHNPINNKDVIMLNAANSADIKSGSSMNKPAVVYRQHESVYFGLSKAAGVDLANETVTVGTYPATSQTAIKSMLGVSEPTSIIDDTAGNGDTAKVWSADKVYDQLALKADKTDTVLETTLSRGRLENSTVGTGSFAFGNNPTASGDYSHAEGATTTASGNRSHAEGTGSTASGADSHAEGINTIASGVSSHAEGNGGTYTYDGTTYTSAAVGTSDHTEGYQCLTTSGQPGNHAEGYQTRATGGASHSEGALTLASGSHSHAEGSSTKATGVYSHAEGQGTTASATAAHAEGAGSNASAVYSHAEGYGSTTSEAYAHAEGLYTIASGSMSHAEGTYTEAKGTLSHVSGEYNVVDSYDNWSEWTANTSYVVGDKVKYTSGTTTQGYICKTANSDSSFNSSKWISRYGRMNYLEIVGNGTGTTLRSNARALDWDGNEYLKGDLYVGCDSDSSSGSKVATESFVTTRVPTPPSSDGTYYLKCVVSSGTPTYSWATLPTANGVSF